MLKIVGVDHKAARARPRRAPTVLAFVHRLGDHRVWCALLAGFLRPLALPERIVVTNDRHAVSTLRCAARHIEDAEIGREWLRYARVDREAYGKQMTAG